MRISGLGVLTLVGLCIACGDDVEIPIGSPGPKCVTDRGPCDIEEKACLQRLLRLAACERGYDTPPLPEVKLISSEELAQELRDEAEQSGAGTTAWDTLLPKLKLLREGQSTVDAAIAGAASSVAAFYHLEEKTITVITDSEIQEDDDKMYVMLHELTHYLQDRASDLTALTERAGDSADNSVSLTALVEGDAVVNSTRGLISMLGRGPEALDWDVFFDSLEENLYPDVIDSESPLIAARQFLPYAVGGRYVARIWNDYGRGRVDGLFDDWPEALCDWMTLSDLRQDAMLQEPLDCGPPRAPAGFSLYALDSLGASGAFALLAAAGVLDAKLAAALRNDAFAVYVDEAGIETPAQAPAIGVWRLRFASVANAQKFEDAIAPLDLEVRRFDEELAIRVSSGVPELDADALATCPELGDLKPMQAVSSFPADVVLRSAARAKHLF